MRQAVRGQTPAVHAGTHGGRKRLPMEAQKGPQGRGSQVEHVDLVLQTSWENAGPGGRRPTFPSWVCSACPQLSLMPPFKLVLQSVVLLTTCESVCASPRPAALWHPLPSMHRWAGRGLVPRAGAGRTSTCERAARGQMAPGSCCPLHSPSGPRAVAHAKHTSTHHALYTHTTPSSR